MLSRMFPQYRFDYWDTEDGKIWAERIWTARAAERTGKAMQGE